METLEFPLVFEKCPVCGCPDTVGNMVAEEEKTKGKLDKALKGCKEAQQTVVVDPRKMTGLIMKVPVIIWYKDVCAGCGIERYTRIERQDVIPQQRLEHLPPELGGNLPTGFPPFAR